MTIDQLHPVLGLQITAGPLVLRGVTDDDLPQLCAIAEAGIHPPERMPFAVPWTDVPKQELAANTAQYHWRLRADFSIQSWALSLGVWHEGELVGLQAFETTNYLVTRTGETGSWLGQSFQRRGIGLAMRQVICALVFDHLDGEEVTSAAFTDNPASLAVSRKVGYQPNGVIRLMRRDGELAFSQRLVLRPEDFQRGEHLLEVSGLDAFRQSIGLDALA